MVTWPSAKAAGPRCRWGAPFPGGSVSQDLSGCVTFQPASAGSVTLAGLSISAPFVRVDGFTITGGVTYGWDGNAAGGNCDQQLAHDEILSNDTLSGFYVSGVQQVYLVADNVGPTTDSSNNIQPCDPASINNQGAYVNTDHVAVIGSTIHDVTTSNPSGHIEGIHWQDTSYGYVGDSKFLNNDQQDISFHPHGSHDHLDHFLLENNVFDLPSSHHTGGGAGDIGALTWGCDWGTLVDVTVRFNSYQGNDTFDGSFTGGASKCPPIQSYGNILDGPVNDYNCSVNATRITYSHNIFTNGCRLRHRQRDRQQLRVAVQEPRRLRLWREGRIPIDQLLFVRRVSGVRHHRGRTSHRSSPRRRRVRTLDVALSSKLARTRPLSCAQATD